MVFSAKSGGGIRRYQNEDGSLTPEGKAIADMTAKGALGLSTLKGAGYVRRFTSAKNKLDKYTV